MLSVDDDKDVFMTRYICHVTEQVAASIVVHVHGDTVGRSETLDAALDHRPGEITIISVKVQLFI